MNHYLKLIFNEDKKLGNKRARHDVNYIKRGLAVTLTRSHLIVGVSLVNAG